MPCSRGIAEVAGDYLIVTIPDWLAGKLGLAEGSVAAVDNRDGTFNIRPITERAAGPTGYTRPASTSAQRR